MILYVFFNDTATTEIYTLSLHDALPILGRAAAGLHPAARPGVDRVAGPAAGVGARRRRAGHRGLRLRRPGRRAAPDGRRSEEHTSELQSRQYLVCRLLLEKKKMQKHTSE